MESLPHALLRTQKSRAFLKKLFFLFIFLGGQTCFLWHSGLLRFWSLLLLPPQSSYLLNSIANSLGFSSRCFCWKRIILELHNRILAQSKSNLARQFIFVKRMHQNPNQAVNIRGQDGLSFIFSTGGYCISFHLWELNFTICRSRRNRMMGKGKVQGIWAFDGAGEKFLVSLLLTAAKITLLFFSKLSWNYPMLPLESVSKFFYWGDLESHIHTQKREPQFPW